MIEMNQSDESWTVTFLERCVGPVRWAPLSSLQGHRNKLQQLYEVIEYRNGTPHERREEWRDVPVVS